MWARGPISPIKAMQTTSRRERVHFQRMTPIAPALHGRAEIPTGVLDHVVVDASGRPYRDPVGEAAAAMAMQ